MRCMRSPRARRNRAHAEAMREGTRRPWTFRFRARTTRTLRLRLRCSWAARTSCIVGRRRTRCHVRPPALDYTGPGRRPGRERSCRAITRRRAVECVSSYGRGEGRYGRHSTLQVVKATRYRVRIRRCRVWRYIRGRCSGYICPFVRFCEQKHGSHEQKVQHAQGDGSVHPLGVRRMRVKHGMIYSQLGTAEAGRGLEYGDWALDCLSSTLSGISRMNSQCKINNVHATRFRPSSSADCGGDGGGRT